MNLWLLLLVKIGHLEDDTLCAVQEENNCQTLCDYYQHHCLKFYMSSCIL